MENDIFMKFTIGDLCGESIVAISEFNYLCLEIWVGREGWFIYKWDGGS